MQFLGARQLIGHIFQRRHPCPLHPNAGFLGETAKAFKRGVRGFAHEIIEDHLHRRPGMTRDHLEQSGQLGIIGLLRWQRAFVLVIIEKVGRQAHCARRQRIFEQRAHLLDFIRRRRARPRLLPHHAQPHRDMAAKRAEMHRQLHLGLHRRLILAPLLPIPRHDFAHRLFRDVFKVIEDVDHVLHIFGALRRRREAEPAIAVDRRRCAIGRQRLQIGRPPHTAIPVIMRFDEARRDIAARSIDHALTLGRLKVGANLGNPPTSDADISEIRRRRA